jgi:hypothetical protein
MIGKMHARSAGRAEKVAAGRNRSMFHAEPAMSRMTIQLREQESSRRSVFQGRALNSPDQR